MKQKSFAFLALIIFLGLSALSCSKAVQKPPLQIEAEQQAEQWWNASFSKCNETLVTKYKGSEIAIVASAFPASMREGFFAVQRFRLCS